MVVRGLEREALLPVALRVACLDGETLALTVPERSRMGEFKRAVGEARGVHAGLIDIFKMGGEDALPDAERLPSLGVGEASVLFMLQRAGWIWETCGSRVTLSGEGLVARRVTDYEGISAMVTGT